MFCFKRDRRRTSPKQESGQAISDPYFFTLTRTRDLGPGKSVDCSIPRPETWDSPRSVSTGGSFLEKGGYDFFSRDA